LINTITKDASIFYFTSKFTNLIATYSKVFEFTAKLINQGIFIQKLHFQFFLIIYIFLRLLNPLFLLNF